MAYKRTGRPTGRPKRVIDWQKFEFGWQINGTKEEILPVVKSVEMTLDAEYSAHYDLMVMASQALVDSGLVRSGTVVRLEMLPVPFLRKVPLLRDSEDGD
jgi:hypothetical protein